MEKNNMRMALHPVPGSAIGVWREERARECFACNRLFWSWGKENRACQQCLADEDYAGLAGLVEVNLLDVYDKPVDPLFEPETPEAMAQERKTITFYDKKKAIKEGEVQGKRVICPQCGDVLYRPGNADEHPCFLESQADLDRKIRDLGGV